MTSDPTTVMAVRHVAIIASCFLFASYWGEVTSKEGLANGLGNDYEWHTLDKGLKLSRETGKPLMIIIHKSWCGACKALKPKFAASKEIKKLSTHFVMVNTIDDEEPSDEKYTPDGGYIPRILFLNSDGEVQTDIVNANGNPKYKYYYFDDIGVMESMKKAMKLLSPPTREGEL